MYTIGQFSKICKVTTKALRHYEKIGLLIPYQIDRGNQYRYYSADQVSLVKNISFMKELGIPLSKAQQMIDKLAEPYEMKAILEEHKKFLLKELDLCSSRLLKLTRWQKALEVNEMSDQKIYDVRLRNVQEMLVRSTRRKLTAFPQDLPPLIRALLEEIQSLGEAPAGPPMILYYDEEFNPEEVDIEVTWPVINEVVATKKLQKVEAAACIHVGPYNELENAYEAIFSWINQNGYKAVYPVREISYNDPAITPPEQLVTEIVVPVIRD